MIKRIKDPWKKLASGLYVPPYLKFAPGYPCCCSIPCTQFEDNFDRANNTDVGSNWSEEVGDWSIASNKLSISSADALCLCEVSLTHPYTIQVVFSGDTLNDTIKIIFNYVDSDNYTFINIEVDPNSFVNRTEFINRVGGVETMLVDTSADVAVGQEYTITICVFDTYVRVVGAGFLTNFAAHLSITSSVCGLATGGTVVGTVTFDDFQITTPDSVNSACSPSPCTASCPCSDEFDSIPTTQLEVVIEGIANNAPVDCNACAGLNDTYLLYMDTCVDSFTQWIYTFPGGGPCNSEFLRVGISGPSGPFSILIAFEGIDGGEVYFQSGTLASDVDCNSFDEFDVPITGFTNQDCDISAATCTLTSIVP